MKTSPGISLPPLSSNPDPAIPIGFWSESNPQPNLSSEPSPSEDRSLAEFSLTDSPSPASPPEPVVSLTREVQIFFSTFVTIFLAELGDKTQVTTLLMSAESDSPWLVFAGAGTALVATSLIGVLMGHWLSKRVSPRTLEVAAAVMLLIVALLLVWDVVQV